MSEPTGPLRSSLEGPFSSEELYQKLLAAERENGRLRSELERHVTERRQAEQELLLAKERAESATRARADFLATMSHEMRTPLHAIVGFTELLEGKFSESGDEEGSMALEAIRHASELLTGLIDNTLELALIESGRMEVKREPCDLRKLAEALALTYQNQLRENRLELYCEIGDDVPRCIMSDRACLHRICSNLLSNSIKFSPPGRRIWVQLGWEHRYLLLHIRDEGIGIHVDKLDTIFEKFVQVDNTTTRRFGGTGLGLSLTKEIVELLHGEITVQSMFGQGSTFSVRLPCAGPEAAGDMAEFGAAEHSAPASFAGSHRVLLVEDNPINRKVAKGLFARLGLTIELASNGEEAVRRARELHPDIIFMDIHMPVMGGLEAAQRIHALPQLADTPIIALSADAFLGKDDIVKQSGIIEYLTKPLHLQKLAKTLERHLTKMSAH